jgi:mercuric ion transport protein
MRSNPKSGERSGSNETDGPGVSDRGGGACGGCDRRADSESELAVSERRGLLWVVGAFLICPCHLPLTLAVAAGLLAGTTAGAVVRDHPIVVGLGVSIVWAALTWHGLRLLRAARPRYQGPPWP